MPRRIEEANRLAKIARYVVPIGFALVLLATLAVIALLFKARESDYWVEHTAQVQQTAQSLLISLRDVSSSSRNYLLFGDSKYLDTYNDASKRVPEYLHRFRALTMDNSEQQSRADKLGEAVPRALTELEKAVALGKAGQHAAAMGIADAKELRDTLDMVRDEVRSAVDSEGKLFLARHARATQLRDWLTAGIAIALLTATLLAIVLAFATRHALKGLLDRTKELETESRLRHEAESTLRQSQKMEAVGQLTGGIAHDFNNLLTIIIGNLDTVRRRLSETKSELTARLLKPLDSAIQGARSAAQLTQRLLAFSRRQALEPARLDVNRLVSDMIDLLRRTLGERISIETVLAAGLWPTFLDAHQLENALLNVALNSKAAMPNGGCLTIETANAYLDSAYALRFGDVEPGQYVLLSITDTGTGIPKDIVERVFEPFFTTKPRGEGSGLGLAMVHGFVKQSGGHVRLYSEDGHGTTVKIYLPRLNKADEVHAAPVAKPADMSPARRAMDGETILLVEDSDGVREYAKEVLETLGYHVLEASDAQEALLLLDPERPIDLLFTDVVLPGSVTGRVLADQARELLPGLPVLFTTGYTRNAIVHQGRLDPDVHLLNKPYTEQELGRKVRELLDGSPRKAKS